MVPTEFHVKEDKDVYGKFLFALVIGGISVIFGIVSYVNNKKLYRNNEKYKGNIL